MRLTSLALSQYGNFASEQITLDPRPGRITLVVAPNGAGKSVLRQAFGDLLFGIGGQSPMAFRFSTKGMRILAEAVAADGTTLRFGRRKGQGVTLIDAQGQALPAGLLAPMLGGTDRALLEQLFALDTERLRRGAAGLLHSGGSLADALLAGAGGLRQATALAAELCAARDALAPARKSEKRPYYKALEGLAAARRQKQQDTQTPAEHARRKTVLDEAQGRLDALNADCRRHAAALARVERVRRTRPILAELAQAQAWLHDHPDAPLLPEGLAQRLSAAREAVLRAADARDAGSRRVAQAEAEAARITPDAATLAAAEAIENLLAQAGAAADAQRDLPGREGEHREASARIAVLLRDLGGMVPATRAGDAVAPKPARLAARRLIQRHGELDEALQRLPSRIASLEHSRDELLAKAGGAPEAAEHADKDRLPALIAEIRGQGDPGQQDSISAKALADLRAAAAEQLARVPGWQAGVDTLAALAAPTLARLEALDHAGAEARRDVLRHREARRRLDQDSARAQATLDQLRQGGVLPDRHAIGEARRHRDRGWHLVFQHLAGPAPEAAAVAAWSDGAPLPLAYERAVTASDALADRRADEAQLLADAELHRSTLARLRDEALSEDAALEQARRAEAQCQAAWADACAQAGQPGPATLAELRVFLACRDAALQARREMLHAEEVSALLRQRHSAWAARLAALLGPGHAADASCQALLLEADALCTRRDLALRQHALTQEKLRAVQEQLDGSREDFRQRSAQMLAWQEAWEASLVTLGRPPAERPATTADVLETMAELELAWQAAAKLAERIDGMRSRVSAFAGIVSALAADLGVMGANTQAALEELRRRLGVAQDAASRRDQLDRALRQARAEQQSYESVCQTAGADLRAVIAAAGAGTEAEAEQRITLAASLAAHRGTEADALARLLDAGDGHLLDALREEAAAISAEEIADAVKRETTAQHEASQAAQAQAADIAGLRQDMARDDDADTLLRAAAAEAAETATAARVLDDALLLHVAGLLLAQAIRSMDGAGESTTIRRIGAYFAQLTDGAYTEAKAGEADDGTAELQVVERAFPDEDRRITALSEGTRDQLFLALRLVAIEAYVAGGAVALPFIADDILQTFDDVRATAALRTLVVFSETTQVIVLTHHRHLAELAAGLPVDVHRLGESAAR